MQQKVTQKTHGKTSVKKLVGEGVGESSIEITDGNIKSFERVAKKYNVDFAITKEKTTKPPTRPGGDAPGSGGNPRRGRGGAGGSAAG